METARSLRCGLGIVGLLLLLILLALAPGVLAQEERGTESSLGAGITGFMQSTAVDADESIESGMRTHQLATDSDTDQTVKRRTAALRSRLSELAERSEALEAARRNGSVSGVEYTAMASAVHAQLANLRASIDRTVESARQHGANASNLDDLRESAKAVTGPDISPVVAEITTAGRGPPAGVPGQGNQPGSPGPPSDRGPPGNNPNGDSGPPEDADTGNGGPSEAPGNGGNGDGGPPENADNGNGGPPGDAGNSDQNDENGGPPGDAGNSDQNDENGGPPGDAGSGGESSGNSDSGRDGGAGGNGSGGQESPGSGRASGQGNPGTG